MRVVRIFIMIAAPGLALAACADSPTSPTGAPVTAAAGGSPGVSSGGGSAAAAAKVSGQWAGAFQSTLPYDSNVSFTLAESGGVVTGSITFTLKNVPGQKVSAIAGTWDGTNLTLRFDTPAGPGHVSARPSAHTRYGTGFVALVVSDDGSGATLGTFNVGRQ